MSTAARGYYSLIQHCPNRSRLESANVGVVLFSPTKDYLGARLSQGNDRLRRFFKGEQLDLNAVNAAKRAIFERLRVGRESFQTLDDLQQFVDTRANSLLLTPPRAVKVVDGDQDLNRLFDELVGGRAKRADVPAHVREVERIFRAPELTNRIRFDTEVRVPVIGRKLTIPYAYQNGALNLVKPVIFHSHETKAENTAMRLSVEGDLIARHGLEDGRQAQLILIPEFSPGLSTEASQGLLQLFGQYKVRTVRRSELAAFAQEVRDTAHG